jgi:hypothetical protein
MSAAKCAPGCATTIVRPNKEAVRIVARYLPIRSRGLDGIGPRLRRPRLAIRALRSLFYSCYLDNGT